MAFKPIDPKRDEYRRYLERGGIIESLTKVFVRILKERPEDPTQYLLHNLGDARLQADNIAYLQAELEDARMEIQRLSEIIRTINPELLNESSHKNTTARDGSLEDSINSNELQQESAPHHTTDYTPANGSTLEESTNHAHNVSSEGNVVQNENGNPE